METIDEFPGRCSTKATSTVTESQRLLLKLGHGYKRAKAQQILRLLKDQESLNKRFKDCALDDPGETNDGDADDEAEQPNENGAAGDSENDIKDIESQLNKKRAAMLKKVSGNVDPSRCRTSMGFYNAAECSNSVDGDIDAEEAENIDLELDMGAEADMSFDEHDPMSKLSFGSKFGKQRRLFRLQLNEEPDAIPEESVAQSARSSRPKTGIAGSSAKSRQYRRPSQADSFGRSVGGSTTVSTTVSKLDGPFTPRGGVRGFCDGQITPRDDTAPCLTPRHNELKLCLTPRQDVSYTTSRYKNTEFKNCFTPRHHDTNPSYTPRQNDINLPYTPRPSENTHSIFSPRPVDVNVNFTPRSNELNTCLTPRQNELCLSQRFDDALAAISPRPVHHQQRGARNYNDHLLTSRDDTAPCATPRRDDVVGCITPRSYNKLRGPLNSVNGPSVSNTMRNGRLLEKSLFEMTPNFSSEPVRAKKQSGGAVSKHDHGHHVGKRGSQLVPRTVLSVDKSPLHYIPTGTQDGEVPTPRRQKAESNGKKRGCADMQRVGVHQNLNKLSEHVHPIAVMKLPPLDAAIHKPVVS